MWARLTTADPALSIPGRKVPGRRARSGVFGLYTPRRRRGSMRRRRGRPALERPGPGRILRPMPGPLRPGALLLAPMVALSHRALRELVLEFGGLDLAFTEMASAGAVVSGAPYEDCYLDAGPLPELVSFQLYATKPERLPEALAFLSSRPAFGADLIFGCGAPHITKAGGGAAWMREPERAFDLVRSARSAWDRPLSVKLRLGQDQDYERLSDFVRGIKEAGADFASLHPRMES